MKQHLKMDGVKIFAEDEKAIQQIMLDHKLHPKTGRSKAHRIALKTYMEIGQIPVEQRNLANQVEALTQQVQQLYFILQEKMK